MANAQLIMPKRNPTPVHVFSACEYDDETANSPNFLDTSEFYKCKEGEIEIRGHWTIDIQDGYAYPKQLGRLDLCRSPDTALTKEDFDSYMRLGRWCNVPNNRLELCGPPPKR